MFARLITSALASLAVTVAVFAQGVDDPQSAPSGSQWNTFKGTSGSDGNSVGTNTASGTMAKAVPSPATDLSERRPIARVTKGIGTLPNDHGQVWREYDISPYTRRITDGSKPEQAIVDWILRETGTEAWFSDPLGLLSANGKSLRVYHTPRMQELVSEVVDRFVSSDAESHTFGVRMMTVTNPNWRTRALPFLRPVTVKTPGLEAWLLSKENAAVLLAELKKRSDYREHNSSNLVMHNGQSSAISLMRPKNFTKAVQLRQDVWPGYEMQMGQVEEGFTLQLHPLLSLDGKTIDAVIKCDILQVEKLVPVWIDVPTSVAPRQRVQIQVPQIAGWRLHERFRWPADSVLLISGGVVATPGPGRSTNAIGISSPFTVGAARANALLLVESKGKASKVLPEAGADARTGSLNYRGRY